MADDLYRPMIPTHYADIFKSETREHIPSVDCWCKPWQADDDGNVWVHRDNDEGVGHA